jgi:hypothetical protein
MKFKEYTIQLTISVKTDEMGNKNFSKEFFLRYRYGQMLYFFKSQALGWFLSEISFGSLFVIMMDLAGLLMI